MAHRSVKRYNSWMSEGAKTDGAEDEKKVVTCTMCRREVPVEVMATLMGRPVCLDCAASFFEPDEEDRDKESPS